MADYMLQRPDLIVCGEGIVRERILMYSINGSEASLVQNGHFSSVSASKRTLTSQDNIADSAAKSSLPASDSCGSLAEGDNSVYDARDFDNAEPKATPSYLKLSRAIGGYAPYNTYTSIGEHERLRTDNCVSRGKSQSDAQYRDCEVVLRNGDPVVTVKQPRQTSVYGSTERHSQRILSDKCDDASVGHVNAGNHIRQSSSSFVADHNSRQSVSPAAASSGPNAVECCVVPSVRIVPPSVPDGSRANVAVLHDGISNRCDASTKRSSFHPICIDLADSETSHKDGHHFLNLVDNAERWLKLQCDRTEVDLEAKTSDEAEGKMRAAIGKANLLIHKKFPQFRQLCHANLDQKEDDPFKTTEQDLSGFWDMVLIQVEDVGKHFEEIEQLRLNGWNEIKVSKETHSESLTSSTKPSGTKTKTQKSSLATNVRSPATTSTAAAKAREEARKRLMAAKAVGRQRKASESDKDIEIFVS